MKAFAIFLSFYIILLSAIPCVDVVRHATSDKVELTQSTTDDHHENDEHCSPFCTCICCQAIFNITDCPVSFSAATVQVAYHGNNPDFKSLDLFDFLIPPKS